jgi:hypothetical protein
MRMRNGVEPSLLPKSGAFTPDARPLRVLPPENAEARAAHDALIQRLAADRIRDLRDDGVTLAYVARMYGVDPGLLERISSELLPSRTR